MLSRLAFCRRCANASNSGVVRCAFEQDSGRNRGKSRSTAGSDSGMLASVRLARYFPPSIDAAVFCEPRPPMVVIAQLVRAPDCGSGGRRFKSAWPPFTTLAVFLEQRAFFVALSEDASSEFPKFASVGNAFNLTAADCESLENSVGTATRTATADGKKFSAQAAMRCLFSVGSDVTDIDGSDSTAPCTSSNRGSV